MDFLSADLDGPAFGKCMLVLDIEMPVMDGWQFLEAYEKEFAPEQKEKVLLTVLSIHSNEKVKKKPSNFLQSKNAF